MTPSVSLGKMIPPSVRAKEGKLETAQIEQAANEMRMDIISMISMAGSGHPGGSLSCIDILGALYLSGVMKHDPENPGDPARDRFILSKGHAAPALYAVLARTGYIPKEELMTLRKLGSNLQGHPDRNLVSGVEVSTGSLGQGLSIACGLACGLRLENNDARVFTLLGDGECEEGQVWEAAMFASHQKLDHVIAIIDHNGLQIDGAIQEVCNPEDLKAKFTSFGWDVTEVDGHDIAALIDTCTKARATLEGKPHAIIAHTVKGKGVSFMENVASWHGKAPNEEETATALRELAAKIERGA